VEEEEEVEEEVDEEVEEDKKKLKSKNSSSLVLVDSNNDNDSESDLKNNDNILDTFYSSNLRQTDDNNDFVKLSAIHSKFKKWFLNQDDINESLPDKSKLKSFFNSKLGKSKKGGWYSIKLL
jgi:hypothetical protein